MRHKGLVIVIGGIFHGVYYGWSFDGLGEAAGIEITESDTYICGYSGSELQAMYRALPLRRRLAKRLEYYNFRLGRIWQ